MSDFHFLRPLWLLALIPLGLLLWRLRRLRGGGGDWAAACDPHLLAYLQIAGGGGGRYRLLGLLGLLGLGWLLAVLALAGPAWQQKPVPVFQSVAARVIVLDLSRSMESTDLAPSRLVRARYKIEDILARSGEGQVGLVVYAGDAFTVAPLTRDGATVAALLDSLDPTLMPSPGSRAERGLEQAARLLERAGRARGEILLVGDQADPAAIGAAARLREEGFTVSVLGVGTPQGAPVPLPRGGYLHDGDGNIVVPRLEEERLRELASAGGGRYARLSATDSDLTALLPPPPTDVEAERVDRNADRWYEEGVWLLPLLLPLAALAFRRGWLLVLPLAVLLAPPAARAQDWSVLWLNQEQRASEALSRGEPQKALALSRDPLRQGTAAYRAGDYEAAAEAFGRVPGAEGHYNRGNALARQGRLDEAAAAYQQALKQDPNLEDARHNLEEVRRAREEQNRQAQGQQDQGENRQQQDQQQDPQQDQQQNPQQDQGQQNDRQQQQDTQGGEPQGEDGQPQPRQDPRTNQNPDQDPDEGQQPRPEPTDAPPEEPQNLAAVPAPDGATPQEDEQRQAVEQWLRRVPDDPGGLLRRKFLYQYQRRNDHFDGGQPW